MLTLTFAGDESGDVSFSFGKGASRYFVFAVVATNDPHDLRQVLLDVRQGAGLKRNFEFSFHSLSSTRLRMKVFEALRGADFEAWGIIIDKTILPDVFKVMSGMDFYIYYVSEMIRTIPEDKRQGATLILDQFGSAARVRTGLRRVMKARGITHLFRSIVVRRSHSELLIQVADLVAGSILRRETKKDSSAYDTIQSKMREILEYRP